jgi:hypothetical protein
MGLRPPERDMLCPRPGRHSFSCSESGSGETASHGGKRVQEKKFPIPKEILIKENRNYNLVTSFFSAIGCI